MSVTTTNVELALMGLVAEGLRGAFPQVAANVKPLVTPGRVADYQCNNAMGLVKELSKLKPPVKMAPKEIGAQLVAKMPQNDLIAAMEPTDQGFINISISKEWVAGMVSHVVQNGLQPPENLQKERVLVDFSSPNVAKEMHVGHLRSTIIGECLCRVFEFIGHDVARINHVGDWGTQFGMLIHYMKTEFPDFLNNPPDISDLVAFYREAKARFDASEEFKEQSRLEVVKLQALEEVSVKAWKMLVAISRVEFDAIYSRLGVIAEERGESFYNPMLPEVCKMIESRGLSSVSEGAKIIVSTSRVPVDKIDIKGEAPRLLSTLISKNRDGSLQVADGLEALLVAKKKITTNDKDEKIVSMGKKESKPWAKFDPAMDTDKLAKACEDLFKPTLCPELAQMVIKPDAADKTIVEVPRFSFPLMMVKSDGGYTYDSTDLAAIYHRFVVEKHDRVVYVTDVGQFEHFRMVAQTAEDMGWMVPGKHRWQHAGFGLVMGEDAKKMKTRSGATVKLKDLLDEACTRSLNIIEEREKENPQNFTAEEMQQLSKIVGYGAVKYFDLKQNRTTNYAFSFDKMLEFNGNTAVFLLYSYARICSIKRKAGVTAEEVVASAASTKVVLEKDSERELALAAFKFNSVIEKVAEDLLPSKLTDFLYALVGKFSDFYHECIVVGHELQGSRLLVCELVAMTIKKGLFILGMEVADRM